MSDRNPSVNQQYPPDAFHHNGKGGSVLDVTQPPFNAKGDGVADDTSALVAALRFVRDHYEVLGGDDFSMCIQKANRNWTVYLPDGEYLVSDTVSQGWPALAMNILKGWSHCEYLNVESPKHEQVLYAASEPENLLHGNPATPAGDDNEGCFIRGQYNGSRVYDEVNWAIRVIGQSRDRTIIRLKDASPGFGKGECQAVLAFYLLQRGSNVNIGNVIENVTIETGEGNSGAVGMKWNASNWGGVRNVAIRSGDGQGHAGLVTDANNATGYHHDLIIDGFNTGIEIAAGRETLVTLEHATLSGQHETAIRVGDGKAGGGGDSLSARKLLVQDAPVAIRAGRAGQVVLLESELRSSCENEAALIVENDGFLLARNVRLSGYRTAVVLHGHAVVTGDQIDEYTSAEPIGIDGEGGASPVRLPVKDSPLLFPEQDLSQWASVGDFGAVGDGLVDDTAAIQRAMESGKPVVCFPKANYVINGTVDVPASVREITCFYGSVCRAQAAESDGPALFRVSEACATPLHVHQAMTAGGVFLDHEADRPVVLEDVYVLFSHCRGYASGKDMVFPGPVAQETETWRLYRNTRPDGAIKELFVNDCLYFAGDNAEGGLAIENVHAWIRMVNTEHLDGALYSFRRSDVWIFGFKSEAADTLLAAKDNSRIEVLGGTFLNFEDRKGPVIVSCDSQVSALFYMWHWALAAETIWRDEEDGGEVIVPSSRFKPLDGVDGAVIFLKHGSSAKQRTP